MKKFFLSLGLVSAMASGLMAETYDGLTTPMPSAASWAPTTAAPGVYSKLVGEYQCNLTTEFYSIYPTNNLFSRPKAYIVDENNEIVSTATLSLMGVGTRYYNYFRLVIDEADAVTEPGRYYMIYPLSNDPSSPVPARTATTGLDVEIYNLKAGPYVVGDVGEPVDAEITVTPSGVYEQQEGIAYVTLTVGNVDPDMFNVGALLSDEEGQNLITVTGPAGTLDMARGEKEGNEIKWMFPFDNTGEASALLIGGDYTITIDYSSFTAYTSELNPLTFPATGTYTFKVDSQVEKVVPGVVSSPVAGEFETWTAKTIGLTLQGYKFDFSTAAQLKENAPKLILVDPDGETYDLPVSIIRSLNAVGYDVSGADFTKYGTYNFYWKTDGYDGIDTATGNKVIFGDITISYSKPAPIPVVTPAVEQINPAPLATSWKSSVTALKLPDYTLLDYSKDEWPALEITTPSGDVVAATAFRYTAKQYQYQLTGDWQKETGLFKAVWKLGGWKATDAEGETVQLTDVEFTYMIGDPTEPEDQTTVGTAVSPAPGTQKELDSISLVFGPEFISDFVAWTPEFSAKATVTKVGNSMGTSVDPVLSEDGTTVTYAVNLPNDETADYRIAINLWGQKYYVAENARALKTAYVPEEKAWVVLDYTVDKATGIQTVEGAESAAIYFDLNGNRLQAAPANGIYIRVNNGKASKAIK